MLDVSYSPHDLCQTIFVPLNCDGTPATQTDTYNLSTAIAPGALASIVVAEVIDVNTTPPYGEITLGGETFGYASYTGSTFTLVTGETSAGSHAALADVTIARAAPIVHCALTQTRLVPLVTDEVVDTDPSGQANQNVAYRRIPPQANGFRFEADLSSRENPVLWAMTDQFAPILDPGVENQVIGFEEIVGSSATCPTCGTASATCKSVAAILIFNAWCGEERHATYPYVAQVLRDLEFEPIVENVVRGRGFNAGRVLRAGLRQNTAFVDPWGIDPRGAGVTARWSEILISQTRIDADADLENLLTNGCGCGSCPAPALAWPTP